jgi:hypothetical protein
MHVKSRIHNSIALFSLKKLTRDSYPGLLERLDLLNNNKWVDKCNLWLSFAKQKNQSKLWRPIVVAVLLSITSVTR